MKHSQTILANGITIFAMIGVFFLILELFGLSDITLLRLFNVVFVIYGVNRAIKSRISNGNTSYLSNLAAGVLTSFVGVLLSVIAIWIYLGAITGPEHMNDLANSILLGGSNDLSLFCISLAIEGLASSVIISFTVMQRWKNTKSVDQLIASD
ncbi:MAG: hypothetical protein ACJA0U_000387 [Salibacteraceae bacterium]|jgi:hypothetical protein